jgi:protein-disulfide isomerase
MKPISIKTLAAAAFSLGLLATTSLAVSSRDAGAQALDRPAVEKIIREYLLENPELMLEVQKALEDKQQALQAARQATTLAEKKDVIYNSPHQMIIGDPEAPVTVVEFFDYNCGFCKRALSDMNRIVEENPDVKFVMKEFPVLGEPSLDAHKISLSIIRLYPELYNDFHTQLLTLDGRKDGNSALELAVSLGADAKALQDESNKPEIMDAIAEVYELADGLNITGTPSYIVGEEVIFGAVGYNRIMPKVANLRECGQATC